MLNGYRRPPVMIDTGSRAWQSSTVIHLALRDIISALCQKCSVTICRAQPFLQSSKEIASLACCSSAIYELVAPTLDLTDGSNDEIARRFSTPTCSIRPASENLTIAPPPHFLSIAQTIGASTVMRLPSTVVMTRS